MLEAFDSLMTTWVGHHEEATMPPMKDRLEEKFKERYDVYRFQSGRAHASFVAATFQFAIDDQGRIGKLIYEDDRDVGHVPFAAGMTCALAIDAYSELPDGEATEELGQLYKELLDAQGLASSDLTRDPDG